MWKKWYFFILVEDSIFVLRNEEKDGNKQKNCLQNFDLLLLEPGPHKIYEIRPFKN